jgi:signal transduction histidine kinase
MDSYFISLYSKIDNNTYIYMGTPVKAIEESAKIATTFSVFTGIMILVLGGIIILFLTSRLTKPIEKLNQIARKMSSLDFSERYNMKSGDEIGTLGESINSLSEQLEQSIGELRQANAKLIQDIERERKIDEMRKEFISNVSHELKTPIALIQGYSEGLLLNVNEDEENKNYYCEVIKDEAVKMNILVRKLLSLSELESNTIPLDKEDFGICEIIENVLKKKTIDFDEKGARVELVTNGNEIITVIADYYLIEQVLFNYISTLSIILTTKK